MQLDLSVVDQQQLQELATVAGYGRVEDFVTDQVLALLRPAADELSDSVAQCDRSMAEAKRGEGRGFRESLETIRRRNGLAE